MLIKICEEILSPHNCPEGNPLSKKFSCRLCGEELKSQVLLKKHFKNKHPRELLFKCPTCGQRFDDAKEMCNHVLTCFSKRSFECSLCLTKLETKHTMHNHYKTHSKTDRNVCLVCNRRYVDASALAKHRHVHTGERRYKCPFCPKSFNLRASQTVHLRRHINYRPYKCKLCPKSFFYSSDLTKHTRSHTGERPYECHVCKFRYADKDVLNTHLKRHKKFAYKCPHCPKAFNTKVSLTFHMSVHTGVTPFHCPICSENDYHLGSLQMHIKKNHIQKTNSLISCQLCGIIKENANKMVEHLMTHRTDHIRLQSEESASRIFEGKKKRGRPKKVVTTSRVTFRQKRVKKRKSRNTRGKNTSYPPNLLQSDVVATVSKGSAKQMLKTKKSRGRQNKIRSPERLNPSAAQHSDQQTVVIDKSGTWSKIKSNSENDSNGGIFEFIDVMVVKQDPDEPEMEYDSISDLKCCICWETFGSPESLFEHVSIHI